MLGENNGEIVKCYINKNFNKYYEPRHRYYYYFNLTIIVIIVISYRKYFL